MGYKSLFTVLTDDTLVAPVLAHAVEAARAFDAHLDVFCLGVDRSQAGYYYASANAVILQESVSRAQEEAETIQALVQKQLKNTTIRWGCDIGVVQLADAARHIAARARFSDLAFVAKPYGEGKGIELDAVAEACLFDSHIPTLITPNDTNHTIHASRVIIAWNESVEAMNAVRAALPILREATSVHVVVIDPPVHGPGRSDPGGMLSQFLARHGVRVEIDVLSRTLPRIGDVLLRHAGDVDAELIVMGAYGHSRFREAIFGGATRHMLEQANLPVLMAH